MIHRLRGWVFAFAFALVAGCTTTATEVLVDLDTDVSADRSMIVTATLRSGRTFDTPSASHSWHRDRSDDCITLPASFALVPVPGQTDGTFTLVVEAQISAGTNGEPPVTIDARVRAQFTPHGTTRIPVFLSVRCAAITAGCSTASAEPCTVSRLCEEHDATCDRGVCVPVDRCPGGAGACADAGSIDVIQPPDTGPVDVRPDACGTGQSRCGTACVDTQTDPANCGTCGNSCPAGANATATCDRATCVSMCNATSHSCAGACVSNTSVTSCGAMSCTACVAPPNATATCDGITCAFACNAGYYLSGGTCTPVPQPRPIAPLSTATVTSRRPTFHWVLAAATDGARVEICRDRACTTLITTIDAAGTSGAPAADLPTGVVFWRLHGRAGGTVGTATGPTWAFTVGVRTAMVNTSWGTTLDVNGDGYADTAVGARGATSPGHAYVFLGNAAALAGTPATTLTEPSGASGTFFGYAVASAGDVNGDGYADLVLGAAYAGANGNVYVYFGSATGLSGTPATTLTGPVGAFGHSVASAGDVNGDGYADLFVGAPYAGPGHAYLYLGSATGLSPTPATSLTGPDGANGDFGISVASVGDTNGDGYADLAVGAYLVGGGIGRAYVYMGSAAGLSGTPTLTLIGPDGANGDFGGPVASAGDVNGDGYADLVIAAVGALGSTGRAYVHLGSGTGLSSTPATTLTGPDGANGRFASAVASAGDVNGDGYADLAVGATGALSSTGRAYVYAGSATGLSGMPATTLTGPAGMSGEFGFSVASAGNVNGDGYADLVVGARAVSGYVGRAYVYVGSASGLMGAPDTTLIGLDGVNGFFGESVASAGP